MSLLLRVVWWSVALLPLVGQAQPRPVPPFDSVAGRRAVPRISRRRLVVQYDSRYSILNYHFTTINGLKLGVEFKNRFRMGAAIYFLSTGVPTRRARPDFAAPDAEAELRFRYLAAYGEYVVLETRRWELSGNLQLGLGSARGRGRYAPRSVATRSSLPAAVVWKAGT